MIFMSFREESENAFHQSFENQTQEALIRALFDAYLLSHNECYSSYHNHEANDLQPFMRWIKLRHILRGMGDRYKNLAASSRPNGRGSSYHIRIDTDLLVLTVSSSDGIFLFLGLLRTELNIQIRIN